MSQRGLAKAAGVSNAYVTMLERGADDERATIENPSLPFIQKLADALHVPVEWLAFETEPEPVWDDSSKGAA